MRFLPAILEKLCTEQCYRGWWGWGPCDCSCASEDLSDVMEPYALREGRGWRSHGGVRQTRSAHGDGAVTTMLRPVQ